MQIACPGGGQQHRSASTQKLAAKAITPGSLYPDSMDLKYRGGYAFNNEILRSFLFIWLNMVSCLNISIILGDGLGPSWKPSISETFLPVSKDACPDADCGVPSIARHASKGSNEIRLDW